MVIFHIFFASCICFSIFLFFDLLFTAKCLDHVVTNPVTDLREVCQVFSLSFLSPPRAGPSTVADICWGSVRLYVYGYQLDLVHNVLLRLVCLSLYMVQGDLLSTDPQSSCRFVCLYQRSSKFGLECRASLRINVHTMHRFGRRVFLVVTVSLY